MVYEPTTNFRDNYGTDLGKKLITQDYVATVYPNLNSAFAGLIASPAELYLWGANSFGELANNTNITRSTPRQEFTLSGNWKQISIQRAIKNDGTLWSWGSIDTGQVGDNVQAFGSGRSTPRQISIAAAGGLTGWQQVSSGGESTLAIRTNGTLWGWGQNGNGQLGDNTTTSKSTPRQISIAAAGGLTGWKQVSCSSSSAAIRYDGTLWAWGINYSDNSSIAKLTPRQEFTSSTNWKQVSCGGFHTLAIKTDGTLWAWGNNSNGQLGDNTILTKSTPRQISAGATGITGWKQVSASSSRSAALRTDGTLWCWGQNLYGLVGDNTIITRSIPTQEFTSSTNWKQVSAGSQATAAIKTDGTLWIWGDGQQGLIADNTSGTTARRSTPKQEFTSSTNWRSLPDKFGDSIGAIKFPLNREY